MAKKRASKVKVKVKARTRAVKKTAAPKKKVMPKKKAVARRASPRRARKAAPPVMDQEAMMAAWQKAMTPGEGHQRLEPFVGSWNATTTFWMGPDAPPSTSEGTSEQRWVLGGRYVEQVFKGTSMGMPFEGLGYTGFDNAQGKYVGTWMDTFSTGIMNSVGVGKPTDTTFDTDAVAFEPTGKRVTLLCKVAIQDRDHHTFEMWTKGPDGRKYLAMRIEYTRK